MDLDLFLQSSPVCDHHFNGNHKDILESHEENHLNNQEKQNIEVQNIQGNIQFDQNWQNKSQSNVDSFKRQSSIMAGKRARQKKKMYVQTLQQKVKELQKQVSRYDQQIKDTKEELSKLVFSAKYNQNKLTYSEIQSCISAQDPNEDRINMLIDMIKFRVGGVGIERQAKIEYFMKQLINTLFLPLQRYLMYCSNKGLDIFKENTIDELLDIGSSQFTQHILPWTKDFLLSINLTETQRAQILRLKPKLLQRKSFVHGSVHKLNKVKEQIKQHQKDYETMIDEIRNVLNPIQGGVWLIFTDRIRYRGQIILDSQKDLFNETKSVGFMPSKKLKKE